MMTENYFYDTSTLLANASRLNDLPQKMIISSITIKELENIKSSNRSEEIKFSARKVLHWLEENPTLYTCWIFKEYMLSPIQSFNLTTNDDMCILGTAIDFEKNKAPDNMSFISNDLSLRTIANMFFGSDSIFGINIPEDNYTGYIEIYPQDEELAFFFNNLNYNKYNLFINQYLLINCSDGQQCLYKWNGENHIPVSYKTFNSEHFGNIKPIKNDLYQVMAMDSLSSNQMTMLRGSAGTGKSWLALSFLFDKLEHGRIDKIIIFCNTVATRNAARLGFYPGSREDKLLDSQIGNLLSAKLGDRLELEHLIEVGKIVLIPMSDARGYDTTGQNAGIYITEAQNMDIELMRLALQRIGDDNICIIDGDDDTQVDDSHFEGINNGMKRASKVFRGADIYGEVKLKYIHRSRIAQIAQEM